MTTHELAKLLFAMPETEVAIRDDHRIRDVEIMIEPRCPLAFPEFWESQPWLVVDGRKEDLSMRYARLGLLMPEEETVIL